MRIFLCLIICVLLTSCGTTFVDYDYDTKVDFSKLTSYNYDFSESTGLLEFDERRVVKYTDSMLQSRGYIKTETNDFFIKITSEEYETRSRNTLGVGVGGGGGTVGVGVSGGIPIGGPERHLKMVVTVYKALGNQATVWEAISESDIKVNAKPDKRDAHFKKLVEKIFNKFPPEQ